MIQLHDLKNTHRGDKKRKRVGRGPGSHRGKTSCRGHKGDKSRSGYKRRVTKEGGSLPLFQKVPVRGFSNARFKVPIYGINLSLLDQFFEDGEVINKQTLIDKGFSTRRMRDGFKVLAEGKLTKKVCIEANSFSKNSVQKLEKEDIEFKRI